MEISFYPSIYLFPLLIFFGNHPLGLGGKEEMEKASKFRLVEVEESET